MQDQYWPVEDDDILSGLPDQFWPEPEFDNPWEDYDADPVKDIRTMMATMVAGYKRVGYVIGRGFGKIAMGHTMHKAVEDEVRKHKVHVHLDVDARPFLSSLTRTTDQLRKVGILPTPIVGYKKLPNGKHMPVVHRGTGPAVEPFKKRGKK